MAIPDLRGHPLVVRRRSVVQVGSAKDAFQARAVQAPGLSGVVALRAEAEKDLPPGQLLRRKLADRLGGRQPLAAAGEGEPGQQNRGPQRAGCRLHCLRYCLRSSVSRNRVRMILGMIQGAPADPPGSGGQAGSVRRTPPPAVSRTPQLRRRSCPLFYAPPRWTPADYCTGWRRRWCVRWRRSGNR